MCPCFMTFALLAILGGLIYAFLVWNFGYWKRRGIKEAKALPLFGSFPSQYTQKRNFIYDIDEMYKKHKKDENFLGVYSSRTPQILILSPEYAHKVYVNDFKHFHDNEFTKFVSRDVDIIMGNNPFVLTGEEWKERRAEITPGLTASRVKSVYPVTKEVCKSFTEYIRKQSKMATKDGINAKEISLRFTTEVVSDCVLGIKAASFTDRPTPVYEMTKKVFDHSFFFLMYNAVANLLPLIRKFYMARFFSKEAEKFFFDLMQTSIDLRRQSRSGDRLDFLNYMLQLQEKKNLSTMDLTSHTMTFLVDGFETTSLVLAHTLLLLGRNPEVQEKLRKEIESIDELSFEAINDMPYLDACFHESLRIFSPQMVSNKLCTDPYEMVNKDGTKLQLEVGTTVLVPVYCLHHDPEIYENPEDFIPERFLEENGGVKKYREMGAYLPFGDGPRVCLGMRFAMTQLKSGIVEIMKNFNIKVNPQTRRDNYVDKTYFMSLLEGGIWLDFEPRN